MRFFVYLSLVGLIGCAHHSQLQSLLTHQLSQNQQMCEQNMTPSTQLADLLTPFQAELEAGKTGIYSLENGAGALKARAWLTDHATQQIDAQYFIFAADNVGIIATERLLKAATRGVKVRLLVDDLLAHGDAQILLAVAKHPNFSVKIYNPNINIGKNMTDIIKSAVTDFRGINKRMHNKNFIVDQKVVITGGRNVGDEYYDFDQVYNFRDRDLLLIGGETKDIQRSFDQFWNSRLSVPIEKILTPQFDVPATEIWRKLHLYSCDAKRFTPRFRQGIADAPKLLQRKARKKQMVWTDKIIFTSDIPGKNNQKDGLYGGSGPTTKSLITLVKNAKKSVVIQSPYLVVSTLGLGLFEDAIKRGVEVKIMTNSLLSTDGLVAFSGYARVRKDLLRAGVKLYEFRPNPARRKRILNGPPVPKSYLGLHAKTMVIDEKIVMVGSFNLDPRSANLNTECIVIVRNQQLAQQVNRLILEEMKPDNSFPSTLRNNPDRHASTWTRFKVWMFGIIPKSIL